ncbi:class I SAM-dependent methyltransferase [Oceanidesulfovibrio marinus]|uniref:Methyltransferase domain-containing protein n=1 Tax=Oceanidesulfovibrio marinus TaxID=370038 RepID=A0ABX6NGP2_9BACT|nr:methyltransferase domain-containing protein [Oceanidesulfovibrio marinus]QJT09810.1 methyltransferase domain-containing protein [Oceanidesulfovibrio marinus]
MTHLQEKGAFFHSGYRFLKLTSATEVARMCEAYPEFLAVRRKFYGESDDDYTKARLKLAQDLCICDFFHYHVTKGAKVLEIGGGFSRLLEYLQDDVEGWNLDKFEGWGNGPTDIPKDTGFKIVPNYIGAYDKNIPDNYFDIVYSISVLEHINLEDEALDDVIQDMERVLKPGGFSVHCIDCRFPPNLAPDISNRRMLKHLMKHYGLSENFIYANHDHENVYHMSAYAYNAYWKSSCGNRPYELDGLPFNIFVAVQKPE